METAVDTHLLGEHRHLLQQLGSSLAVLLVRAPEPHHGSALTALLAGVHLQQYPVQFSTAINRPIQSPTHVFRAGVGAASGLRHRLRLLLQLLASRVNAVTDSHEDIAALHLQTQRRMSTPSQRQSLSRAHAPSRDATRSARAHGSVASPAAGWPDARSRPHRRCRSDLDSRSCT